MKRSNSAVIDLEANPRPTKRMNGDTLPSRDIITEAPLTEPEVQAEPRTETESQVEPRTEPETEAAPVIDAKSNTNPATWEQKGPKKSCMEDVAGSMSVSARVHIAWIFDGHGGASGRAVALTADQCVRRFADGCVMDTPGSVSAWTAALRALFDQMQPEVLGALIATVPLSHVDAGGVPRHGMSSSNSKAMPIRGGSTGTVVVTIVGDATLEVVTANVGDSQAMIIDLKKGEHAMLTEVAHYISLPHESKK